MAVPQSISLDITDNKKFGKKTYDLKGIDYDIDITVTGDKQYGQLEISESGSSLIATVYGYKEMSYWQKVITVTSNEKISGGENKGKYFQSKTMYVYNSLTQDWEFFDEDWGYVKNKGNNQPVTTYEAIDYDGNVVISQKDAPENPLETGYTADYKNVLGTITAKNAAGYKDNNGYITLNSDIVSDVGILYYPFLAVHKGNNFTGTSFNEYAESTSKNETFNLGANAKSWNDDSITFKASYTDNKNFTGFGTDKVIVSKYESLTLNFETENLGEGGVFVDRVGDNIVATVSRKDITADYTYERVHVTYEQDGDNIVKRTSREEYSFIGYEGWELPDIEQEYVSEMGDETWTITETKTPVGGTAVVKTYNQEELDSYTEHDYSEKVLGKVNFSNLDKLEGFETIGITHNGEDISGLYDDVRWKEYTVTGSKNTFKGTWFDEKATSTSANETFTLGKGNDKIIYEADEGKMKAFGKDTVNVDKTSEYLTLSFADDATVDYRYEIKGKDVNIYATRTTGEGDDAVTETVGTVVLKNYLNVEYDCVQIAVPGEEYPVWLCDLLKDAGYLVYDKSESAKGVTITGTNMNEEFIGSDKNDTIKAVGGDNIITGGKGDDKLYGGKGEDYFQFTAGDASGKNGDTVYNAGKNADQWDWDYINFGAYDEDGNFIVEEDIDKLTFAKSGNDLVIRHTDIVGEDEVVDKVTVKDYLKTAIPANLAVNNSGLEYSGATISVSGKGNVNGTYFNDDITITGKSTITTGYGNDTVNLSYQKTDKSGTKFVSTNDTVKINGSGGKYLAKGAIIDPENDENYSYMYDFGDKTVEFSGYWATQTTTNLQLGVGQNTGDYATQAGYEGHIFTKKGNDLNIEGYYNGSDLVYDPSEDFTYDSYGSYTVKDYFKSDNYVPAALSVDDNLLLTKLADAKIEQSGKGTLNGTNYDDYIVATGKSTISTGIGEDTILLTNAADTINVDGYGTKTIHSQKDYAKPSFARTINYTSTSAATMQLGFQYSSDTAKYGADSRIYTRSGDDLIIQTGKFDDNYKTSVYGGKYTVKDFFTKNLDSKVLVEHNDEGHTTSNVYADMYQNIMFQNGNKSKNNTLKDTKYNDYITGGEKNDTYTLSNGNKSLTDRDIVIDTKGNDNYTIDGTKNGVSITDGKGNDTYNYNGFANYKSTIITDNAGTDTLNVTAEAGANVNFIFDVLSGVTSGGTLDTSLIVFDPDKFTAPINYWSMIKQGTQGLHVNNFIKEGADGKYQFGAGRMENITLKKGEGEAMVMSDFTDITALNETRAAVASWLSDHTQYKSAYDAISDYNNVDNINSLLNVYATGAYNPS